MEANVHTPERLVGETFKAYRERRVESKRITRGTTGHHLNGGTNSRKTQRDSMRSSGRMGMRTRAYVALLAYWASKRVPTGGLRDENGAYTLIGRLYQLEDIKPGPHEHEHSGSSDGVYVVQRKWLGGISAQRGY